jgi:hypothetical protein
MPVYAMLAQVAVSDFDLAKIVSAQPRCSEAPAPAAADIVVCAKVRAKIDLPAGGMPVQEALPKAEFGAIGKVRASIHGEQASVGGFVSNRAMVTATIPF